MNTDILERLRAFRVPAAAPLSDDRFFVARLCGLDFEGLYRSPDMGFAQPFDTRFAKMMVRTVSHLLGGDACGQYGYTEHDEFSVLLDRKNVPLRWDDASKLQNYLVGLASTKLSSLLEAEAIFGCELFSFNSAGVTLSYFVWRQQVADLAALDRYCIHVLSKDNEREKVVRLLEGLGAREKEEILRQHEIEYAEVPAWQRRGSGVRLSDGGITIDANLPVNADYVALLQALIG